MVPITFVRTKHSALSSQESCGCRGDPKHSWLSDESSPSLRAAAAWAQLESDRVLLLCPALPCNRHPDRRWLQHEGKRGLQNKVVVVGRYGCSTASSEVQRYGRLWAIPSNIRFAAGLIGHQIGLHRWCGIAMQTYCAEANPRRWCVARASEMQPAPSNLALEGFQQNTPGSFSGLSLPTCPNQYITHRSFIFQ